MSFGFLRCLWGYVTGRPDPEFVAQQLRKPSGKFAGKIGQKMDVVNEPLFNLTLETMDPAEDDHILEIGFGTGRYIHRLFSANKGIRVAGVDYSKKMMEMAKQHNRGAIAAGKLDIKQGSSKALPFPEATFDKVFCNMVIYFWEDPDPHLQEIHRVLKPGGSFFTGMRRRKSMLAFPFVDYGFELYTTREWQEILRENGFTFLENQFSRDPSIEVDGNDVHLESCCIAAIRN